MEKMDTKFPAPAGSACSEALVTTAMMRVMIIGMLCVIILYYFH
jgi:hypothetical protein